MSAVDDLNTALADLKTEVAAVGVRMDDNFKKLMDAQAANDPAAIAAATAEVQADIQALKDMEARDTPVVAPVTP